MSCLIWMYTVCKFSFLFLFFAILNINPIALRKGKIVDNFGLSECNRVKQLLLLYLQVFRVH